MMKIIFLWLKLISKKLIFDFKGINLTFKRLNLICKVKAILFLL